VTHFTVSCQVRFDTQITGARVIHLYDSTNLNGLFNMQRTATGALQANGDYNDLVSINEPHFILTSPVLTNGRTYRVFVVGTPTSVRMFIDSALVAEVNNSFGTFLWSRINTAGVGCMRTGTFRIDGHLGDVFVSKTAVITGENPAIPPASADPTTWATGSDLLLLFGGDMTANTGGTAGNGWNGTASSPGTGTTTPYGTIGAFTITNTAGVLTDV
jgi:hypothetical protein